MIPDIWFVDDDDSFDSHEIMIDTSFSVAGSDITSSTVDEESMHENTVVENKDEFETEIRKP